MKKGGTPGATFRTGEASRLIFLPSGKHAVQHESEEREVVDPTHADDAAHGGGRQPHALEPTRIRDEKRSEMAARRMAANEDAFGIAAQRPDLSADETDGSSEVGDVGGMLDLRRESVVHHRDDDAGSRQAAAEQRQMLPATALVAATPASAVSEDEDGVADRDRFFGAREVPVEALMAVRLASLRRVVSTPRR